jgi:hypothetical protein
MEDHANGRGTLTLEISKGGTTSIGFAMYMINTGDVFLFEIINSGTTAILISGTKLVFINNISANPTITMVEK